MKKSNWLSWSMTDEVHVRRLNFSRKPRFCGLKWKVELDDPDLAAVAMSPVQNHSALQLQSMHIQLTLPL